MMKNILLALLILSVPLLRAQTPQHPPIKTEEILKGNHCIEYRERNQNGDLLFSIHVLDNVHDKKINKLFLASQYNQLNKETLSVFALDGLDLLETTYDQNKILFYFSFATLDEKEMKALYVVRNAEEFWALKSYKRVLAMDRELAMIHIMDSSQNITLHLFFSANGDTIETHYQYNAQNKLVKTVEKIEGFVTATEYYTLDDRMNMIHSAKVEWMDDHYDTTEVYNKTYNADSLVLAESFYFTGEFRNKTIYSYNDKRQLEKKTYYQEDESSPATITTFEYNAQGLRIKETIEDFTYSEPKKEIHTFRYTFW